MATTSIDLKIQSLEPGAKVKLLAIDCTEFGGEVYRFHNYDIPYTEAELTAYIGLDTEIPPKAIMWQGESYACWPYEFDGIELDGTGSSPSPSLSVSNFDGYVGSLCRQLQNLFKAKVTEFTTFEPYLDGHEDADVTQFFSQTWYISRKSNEDEDTVGWDLSSPADFEGQRLPKRLITSMCHWAMNGGYRGPDCGYTGTRYATEDGTPTDDPAKDVCGGLCRDCKYRFGEEEPISFGGFIASSLIG